jgi:predicted lipoprotein with Yx(FWY)xxD motif
MPRRIGSIVPIAALAAVLLAGCAKSGAAASGGANPLVVNAGSVSGLGMVLVTTGGFTLYHLPSESASNITCTGQCASAWPPYLLPAGDSGVSAGAGVSGSFGTVQRPDGGGTQVTFDGMPLYTYVGDTAAGEAKGQNVEAFVAVSASGGDAGGGAGSPTSGRGGYGGGGY